MRNQLILISILLSPSFLFAGNGNYPVGGRSTSLAHASVSLTDIWGAFNNQAGLAWLENPSFGFFYENRFLVKEYALQAGVLAVPLKPGIIGANYRYFGYSKYHEAKVGLSFARKLFKSVALGVQINYHQTYLAESYGNHNALTAEIGLMYTPLENLFIGVHAFNPNRVKANADPEEYIPTVYRIGAGYNILDRATILFETEKDIEQKPVFKGGMEISALKNLDFRFGVSSADIEYTFGLGYRARSFSFDLAFSHHNILGFTPHASFTLSLNKKHE